MARKGGPTKTGGTRHASALLRPVRQSADGKMPVHFRHAAYPRTAGHAANRQRYIEREAAREPVPEAGRQAYVDRPEAAEIAQGGALVAHGNLGPTPEARRTFWAEAEAREIHPNARVQHGIIAEFPHEISAAGRLRILRRFGEEVFEKRGLPYWAAGHRPDAHNDSRNYHGHILYYPRPGTCHDGRWSFRSEGETGVVAGQYPWGTTEEPAKRARRMARQAVRADSAEDRRRYETAAAEARAYADLAARRRTEIRGGTVRRAGTTYPWGQEAPSQRARRLEKQLAMTSAADRRSRYDADLAEIRAWQADPRRKTENSESVMPRDKGWIRYLRAKWCEVCNEVLAAEGQSKRYHPGGYKDLGIEATGTKHLGTRAALLDAQGIWTAVGAHNANEAWLRLQAEGSNLDAAQIAAADQVAARAAGRAREKARHAEKRGRIAETARWWEEIAEVEAWRAGIAEVLAERAAKAAAQRAASAPVEIATVGMLAALERAAVRVRDRSEAAKRAMADRIAAEKAEADRLDAEREAAAKRAMDARREAERARTEAERKARVEAGARGKTGAESKAAQQTSPALHRVPVVAGSILPKPVVTAGSDATRTLEAERRQAARARTIERSARAEGKKADRKPRTSADAARNDARQAIRTRPGALPIAEALRRVRSQATEVVSCARALAEISPGTRAAMLQVMELREAYRLGEEPWRAEVQAMAGYHAALRNAEGGRAAIEQLHANVTALRAAANALETATEAHGGLTPRQRGTLHRISNWVESETQWLPLAPGWQSAHSSDPAAGYVHMHMHAALTDTRFMKVGGWRIRPMSKAEHRQAAESQARWTKLRVNQAAARHRAKHGPPPVPLTR